MSKQAKIDSLRAKVKEYKEELVRYGDMFNEDGFIDTEEQKQLDAMQLIIDKVESRLQEMESKGSKGKGVASNINSFIKKIQRELLALEKEVENY